MAGLKSEYGEMDLEDFGVENQAPNAEVTKEAVKTPVNVMTKQVAVKESTFAETQ